jgi:DNA-binding MarR family transcriptional regulator
VSNRAPRAAGHDHVDGVLAEWRKEQPRLDTSPVAVVARIGRAGALLDRGLNENFARFGLNRTMWDVLASLRRIGAPYRRSPTELYRALMRTSGGMTHLVDRLERDGLVERVADPDDRRGLLVSLTRRGRALVGRVGPSHLETERRLLAGLTEQEQAELARLLRKLLIGLEDLYAGPGTPPRAAEPPTRRDPEPRRRRGRRRARQRPKAWASADELHFAADRLLDESPG